MQVTSMHCYLLFGLNWLDLGMFFKLSDKVAWLLIKE